MEIYHRHVPEHQWPHDFAYAKVQRVEVIEIEMLKEIEWKPIKISDFRVIFSVGYAHKSCIHDHIWMLFNKLIRYYDCTISLNARLTLHIR